MAQKPKKKEITVKEIKTFSWSPEEIRDLEIARVRDILQFVNTFPQLCVLSEETVEAIARKMGIKPHD